MEDKIMQLSINCKESILSALKQMDMTHHRLLVVLDDGKFISMVSIGDIQRAIIKGLSLTQPLRNILRKDNITIARETDDIDAVKALMREKRIEFMPIIDSNNDVKRIIFWQDLFVEPTDATRDKIDLPVVIMAGGKGTRLKPLTNVLPKPLIPVGDKTILEVIMDQFEGIGCHKFYMSVNYKADMMKYYLSQLDHKYDIEFFMEDKPLGTIGSVSLLKGKITTPFFVSNCDSINEQDYRDVWDYHVNNHNDMTIVTMIKSFKIPYGVIETGEDGLMIDLKEKPEHTYMVNSGVYILNAELINEIPEGEFFHITHLMEKVKARGGRVGCFPVSEDSWHDMGEWPEYLKMINVL
jgi:dTDP-glucose pyrophosphorylase